MHIRKIAVLGSFAAGAALALAPLASADNLTSTVDSEIAALNALFTEEADLAGDGNDVIAPTATNPFDTIPLADAPTTAPSLTSITSYGGLIRPFLCPAMTRAPTTSSTAR
jgi:hypothetical protein